MSAAGMLKIQGTSHGTGAAGTGAAPASQRDRSFSEGDSMTSTETFKSPEKSQNMETSTPDVGRKRPRPVESDDGMREFFLQALKMNKEEIIQSFQISMGEMAKKVEVNVKDIATNKATAERNLARADEHSTELKKLNNRVKALEGREPRGFGAPRRAVLSDAYLKARCSVRIWPVSGSTEEEMWGNAGEFLHGPVAIHEADVCQDDVEAVFPVDDPVRPENIKNEVVIRFKDNKTRDMVMFSSVNLASCVGPDGKSTAGARLELPEELKDTFHLLSRFGTRLGARHGEGTKPHVKFDDFSGSLYTNVKLPGDTAWTRVTPEMASSDLEASLREENSLNQKRLAAKLIPGPRERLQRPLTEVRAPQAPRTRAPAAIECAPGPSGKRPRWAGPPRRQL